MRIKESKELDDTDSYSILNILFINVVTINCSMTMTVSRDWGISMNLTVFLLFAYWRPRVGPEARNYCQ